MCTSCTILQEQLQVERERFDKLMSHFLSGNQPQESKDELEEEEQQMRKLRGLDNWSKQRARLAKIAVSDHEKYMSSVKSVKMDEDA